MKPAILLFICGLLQIQGFSQQRSSNLVVNPSFEQNTVPSNNYADIVHATAWDSPNDGEASIYGTTAGGYIFDSFGSSWPFKAKSGKFVAAMNVYGHRGAGNENQDRDYIQGSLASPLEVGKKYYFSFWVHYHCEGASSIGIAFLPEKIGLPTGGLIPLRPASYQRQVTPYSTSTTWTQVIDSFIAYQPMTHFIIGNFFDDNNTRVQSNNFGHHLAYIDDVSVVEAASQANRAAMLTRGADEGEVSWTQNVDIVSKLRQGAGQVPAVGAPEIVPPKTLASPMLSTEELFSEAIFFDQNSSVVGASGKVVLGQMANRLNQDSTLRILILGFASGEGGTAYNLRLSQKRAESVRSYLLEQGIAPDRLVMKPLGEDSPIMPNDTEAQRRGNRRVMFRVLW